MSNEALDIPQRQQPPVQTPNENKNNPSPDQQVQPASLTDKLKAWALSHIDLLLAILRVVKPILQIKQLVIVTRFEDVQEVLSRDHAFNVTYEEKMRAITNGSNFFLGMAPSPQYQQDTSNAQIAFRRADIDTIVTPLCEQYSASLVSQHSNQIDFTRDLASKVPAHLVAQYIGIPGPSQAVLIEWTTAMFHYLFFPDTTPEENQKALGYAALAREYIDQLITERKQQNSNADDVLGRYLTMQQAGLPGTSDLDIRNNLIGIIVGAIPTTSKAATLVLEYLLSNPEALESAQQAAKNNNIPLLNQHVLESLRFNPFNPGVFRDCTSDYTIARGNLRSKTVKKGSSVLALTQSAMMDRRKLESPREFKLDRPSSAYMPYGYGLHNCFGQHINNVQIAHILKAVLVKRNLHAAVTKPLYKGPFPSSFPIQFE